MGKLTARRDYDPELLKCNADRKRGWQWLRLFPRLWRMEIARKNSVSVQRHRISRKDAERVRQAEKVGGQQASLEIFLEVLFKKKTALAHFVGLSNLTAPRSRA